MSADTTPTATRTRKRRPLLPGLLCRETAAGYCSTGLSTWDRLAAAPRPCGEAGWLHRLPAPAPGGLGRPADALAALPLLGFHNDSNGAYYAFPQTDAAGVVVGLNRRYADGTKKMLPGGKRGRTLPAGWRERAGPRPGGRLPRAPAHVHHRTGPRGGGAEGREGAGPALDHHADDGPVRPRRHPGHGRRGRQAEPPDPAHARLHTRRSASYWNGQRPTLGSSNGSSSER